MNRPKIASVQIDWIDENGYEHNARFTESTLEEAGALIGLMIGNLCEADILLYAFHNSNKK